MALMKGIEPPPVTFEEWVAVGQNAGWISPGVCIMHDGMPMTDEEAADYEDGGDPCTPGFRVWIEATHLDSEGVEV